MELSTRIANAAQKFVDKKWALCDPSRGWDCLNTLFAFYEEMGVILPREFEGYRYEEYPELWNKDFRKALKILKRWYRTLGVKIEPAYMQRGDLLLFDASEDDITGTATGIFLGNGHVLMVFGKQGVKVLPLGEVRGKLTEVRRLL